MTSHWQPYREPFRATILRTGIIAIAGGAVFARFRGGMVQWPMATVLMLWPSFGGHWVEIWFLNWLRPRLPVSRGVHVVARIATWFAGGIGLAIGMGLTAIVLAALQPAQWPPLWLGGAAFIGIELVVHLALQLRGRPSFYNGRG